MTVEQYIEQIELIKEAKKKIDDRMSRTHQTFISSNKPCSVGDMVEITLRSGKKVKGEAVSFGILRDENKNPVVCITSYKDTKMHYITVPHKSVVKL